MSGMNKNVLANLAAAVAALCAGTSVVVTRVAVGEIDPIMLAFYRYVVDAVCLVPLLPFVWPKVRLPVVDIIKIALLGARRMAGGDISGDRRCRDSICFIHLGAAMVTTEPRGDLPDAQPDNGDIVGGCDAGRNGNALIVGLVFVIAGIFVANWRDADKGAPVKTG